MGLTTSLNLRLSANLTKAIDLIDSGLTAPLAVNTSLSMGDGFSAGNADKAWWDQRTLTASQTEDLDFVGGSLTDPFGVTFTLAKIKLLYVRAHPDNNASNNVVVGGDANAVPIFGAAAHTIALRAGQVFLWTDFTTGVTLTAGTGDLLQVANSAGTNSVVYDIVAIGTSA